MKISPVLLILFVTCCMLDDASCGWICRYSNCGWICTPKCRWSCDISCGKKRDTTFLSPLPCDFNLWDSDSNGSVDFKEFSALMKAIALKKDFRLAFESADKDGNGVLSKDELAGTTFMRGQC